MTLGGKAQLAADTIEGQYSSSWGEPHLRATGRHLPYGITQCYLSPDTSEWMDVGPCSLQL